ncbi:PREDICTED: potassium channel SKOR-like isoform X1 [Nicotiana attenuata]|uniref:potassium channel SKOR-like isoform X1 n=1 Tax=Nicotiana attenuata TaxID=49451 RepID=UPI000904D702|nr:PREDICTED: potassium channel SKOR-like isoform X1 [Nicotiana attenuata]
MDRGKRRGEDSEDDEFKVEDLQESSNSNKLASNWKNRFKLLRNYSSLDTNNVSVRNGDQGRDNTSRRRRDHCYGFVIHPDNWWYLLWTQFILIWAIYSSFFTPMEFGFFRGLPENLFLLDIAGQIAFLIDIVVLFFVAYRDAHSYCMVYDRKLIALRYLKSRFPVDLLGCFPWDAIYKACGRKEPVRYLLWIRLSRALRVTEFFEKLEKDIRLNYLFTRIVKLLVVEVYCTHTAACIFYYLATTLPPWEEGYTWIGSLKMGDYSYAHFRDIDLWTRYITSLYFAIVTMATVGYGEIHAVNTKEMIFVMIYVSFDMILGAYLLGNMAALIVKGSKTEKFRDKMADLIKYMNRNRLGKRISKEIKDHVRLQYESRYNESSVLQDIPASIRAKISQKLYEPYIRGVPLFRGCSHEFIKQIAIKVHEEFFLPGEVIIEQGSMADQLYFVCHGKVEEVRKPEENETEESLLDLHTYNSVGEISVLCNIPVPYTVQVYELSRLLRIDKQSLVEILGICFSDGRVIINNLLEGRESSLRSKILDSDITLNIAKHESELTMRLNCAAHDGDLYRLSRIIGAGADPSRTDYDGRSPLHLAASKGHGDITVFLIQRGVEINARDKFGSTALLEAVKNGHDHVASLLMEAGALLGIDNDGTCLCEAVAKRDLDYLRRLLDSGINPNSKNYDFRTPLHLAASEGLFPISVLLLEAGASVFAVDRWGRTPLDEARVGGNKNLIKLLEDAQGSQLSEFSTSFGKQDEGQRVRCTVFSSDPRDLKDERRRVVLWVPQSLDELINTAKAQLRVSSANCVVSEDGAKILDTDMISDGQKLFLVRESTRSL